MAATTDNELYFWGRKSNLISNLQNTMIKNNDMSVCQNASCNRRLSENDNVGLK